MFIFVHSQKVLRRVSSHQTQKQPYENKLKSECKTVQLMKTLLQLWTKQCVIFFLFLQNFLLDFLAKDEAESKVFTQSQRPNTTAEERKITQLCREVFVIFHK